MSALADGIGHYCAVDLAERLPLITLLIAYGVSAFRYSREPMFKWILPAAVGVAAVLPGSWIDADSEYGPIVVALLLGGIVVGGISRAWWLYRTPKAERGIRFWPGLDQDSVDADTKKHS